MNRICTLLMVLPLAVGCSRWADSDVRASKQRGDVIVSALKAFHSDQGKYPNQLIQLVPNYLVMIEDPLAGNRQWGYHLFDDGHRFQLYFESSPTSPVCYFNSANGQWHIDTR